MEPRTPTLAWEEALLLALPWAGGDSLCRLAVVLGQLSPFLGCAGRGTHLLVKARWAC